MKEIKFLLDLGSRVINLEYLATIRIDGEYNKEEIEERLNNDGFEVVSIKGGFNE